MDKILGLLGAFVPDPDPSESALMRWRKSIAGGLVLIYMMLGAHILLAKGLVPFVDSGFAHANEMRAVQQDVLEMRIEQLEAQLLSARREQCQAIRSANAAAKAFAVQRIIDLQARWRSIGRTNVNHSLPGCEELL